MSIFSMWASYYVVRTLFTKIAPRVSYSEATEEVGSLHDETVHTGARLYFVACAVGTVIALVNYYMK